jgi:hypothetical protein
MAVDCEEEAEGQKRDARVQKGWTQKWVGKKGQEPKAGRRYCDV